jgi:hypothetical protein
MVTKATGHWKIIWTVATSAEGNDIHRQLHAVREVGYDHLTNWGPYTATAGLEAHIAPRISVKKMTYSERRALEEIAVRTLAMVPDGVWDCQTWVKAVFAEANQMGLLGSCETDRAIANLERESRTLQSRG